VVYRHVKRDLYVCQKRLICIHDKRDLYVFEKRLICIHDERDLLEKKTDLHVKKWPVGMLKETYMYVRRDLYVYMMKETYWKKG